MTNALSLTPTAGLPGDDRSLVAQAVGGDSLAARQLYDRHVDRVYRLAFRIAGEPALAAELTQDVFVQLFRALDQFRGESTFTTWLHRVATTTCLNAMRRVKRLQSRELDLGEFHHLATAGGPELLPHDTRAAVGEAIEALPSKLRIALVMYTLEGYSHAEIGTALGIAEGTSKARVSEARARLRTTLATHLEDLR
jgi:RNA polymerase sigma-70 factor (ECF subfamily)